MGLETILEIPLFFSQKTPLPVMALTVADLGFPRLGANPREDSNLFFGKIIADKTA